MRLVGQIFDALYVWLVLAIGLLFFCQISSAESARRFESFRWDVEKHELTATVSIGRIEKDKDHEKYTPERILDYVIAIDEGHVTLEKEVREFSKYEGALMHRVIDLVLQYAVESVEWFEGTRGKEEHKRASQKPASIEELSLCSVWKYDEDGHLACALMKGRAR